MNFALFLTIVGTFLGLFSIILYFYDKVNSRKGLRLDNEGCISLANRNISNLNIGLVYKGKVFNNNIILFKGVLSNIGKRDIGASDIIKPLQIIFREGHILEAYIKDAPASFFQCNILQDKSGIEISWDLLKSTESINFEVLIEFESFDSVYEKELYNSITFEFRIKNVNKISKITKASEELRQIALIVGLACVGLACWAGVGIYQYCNPFQIKHTDLAPSVMQTYINNSDSTEVTIEFSLSQYQVDKFKQAETLEDINENYRLVDNRFDSSKIWVIVARIFIILAFIVFCICAIILFKYAFKSI